VGEPWSEQLAALGARVPTAPESLQAFRKLEALAHQRRVATGTASRPLTDSERQQLPADMQCIHCMGWHVRACPRVKLLDWHPNGKLSHVEYWPPREIDWGGVVWDDGSSDVVPVPRADLEILLNSKDSEEIGTVLSRLQPMLTEANEQAVDSQA
jgi:hypothetical protein